MGKSSPAPIDYEAAALAEGEAAREVTEAQTWANRPEQITPWAHSQWTAQPYYDSTTDQYLNQWTNTTSLNEPFDEVLRSQTAMQLGRSQIAESMLGDIYASYDDPVDWSSFGGMMAPGPQNQISMAGLPDRWGHLQWDLPQYSTAGTLRQLNFGNLPNVNDPYYTLQEAEDNVYQRMQTRLDQQYGSKENALEIKLRNQGLKPGDEAYDAAWRNLEYEKNDAYQNAMNEAIMAGGRESERMFGMQQAHRGQGSQELLDLGNFANAAGQQEFGQNFAIAQQAFQDSRQAAEFQNQARDQALRERMAAQGYNTDLAYREADYYNQLRQAGINELIAQRGYSLNEAMALLQGQQVGMPQFNQFTAASKADTPQMLQAAALQGQANAASASAENAMWGNLIGGGASLASTFATGGMFSDRRLKSNISKIGERNGVNWYIYDIGGRTEIGVMADEVPHAAFRHPSGFLMVDYSKV